MKLIALSLALFIQLAPVTKSNTKVGTSCNGEWVIDAIKSEEFYLNFSIKYPKTLSINGRKATFTNTYYYGGKQHHAGECSVTTFADSHSRLLVFKNCLPSKNPDAIPVHYKIRCSGNTMTGTVYDHLKRFEFKGKRDIN